MKLDISTTPIVKQNYHLILKSPNDSLIPLYMQVLEHFNFFFRQLI